MRKFLSVFLIAGLVFSFLPAAGLTQEPTYLEGASLKAKHGMRNTLTGWMEIASQITKRSQQNAEEGKNKFIGGVSGVYKGIVHALGRTATGIYQLVAALLPNHQSNEGIGTTLDCEYVCDAQREASMSEEGLSSIEAKKKRGAIDLLAGLLEFPVQLTKAMQQTSFMGVVKGLGKSVLYPAGRLVSGVVDIVTAPFPGDPKTYGKPFDTERPWGSLEQPYEEEAVMEEPEVLDIFAMNVMAP